MLFIKMSFEISISYLILLLIIVKRQVTCNPLKRSGNSVAEEDFNIKQRNRLSKPTTPIANYFFSNSH